MIDRRGVSWWPLRVALLPPPLPAVAQPVGRSDLLRGAPRDWSAAPVLPLWPGAPPGGGFVAQPVRPDTPPGLERNVADPALHLFRPAVANGRALLVIPGGAYVVIAVLHEGLDIANVMTARGYTVFVLSYRLPGEGWANRASVPLQDAQWAMRVVKGQAALLGFSHAAVAVVGLSAGGHLAATLATDFAWAV